MKPLSIAARKLRTGVRLKPRDWGIFAEAWLTLLWAHAIISLMPFSRSRGMLLRAFAERPDSHTTDRIVACDRVAAMFLAAARNHVFPMNCLRRSLALQHMLERR